MSESKNVLIGILAVLLGLIVIIFPLISVFALSDIAGIGLIFLGIYLLVQSLKSKSLAAGIAVLLVAIFVIMMGIVFLGDIAAFEFFTFAAIYTVGFFLVLAGLVSLISGKSLKTKSIGVLGILIGILFTIIGTYMGNPLVLAAMIGAFLIIAGLIEIFNLFGENKVEKIEKS
jgi:uncharacterized membrane protein HdeD (DUF308 family)